MGVVCAFLAKIRVRFHSNDIDLYSLCFLDSYLAIHTKTGRTFLLFPFSRLLIVFLFFLNISDDTDCRNYEKSNRDDYFHCFIHSSSLLS